MCLRPSRSQARPKARDFVARPVVGHDALNLMPSLGPMPELVFETHARVVACQKNRALYNPRLHGGPPLQTPGHIGGLARLLKKVGARLLVGRAPRPRRRDREALKVCLTNPDLPHSMI